MYNLNKYFVAFLINLKVYKCFTLIFIIKIINFFLIIVKIIYIYSVYNYYIIMIIVIREPSINQSHVS